MNYLFKLIIINFSLLCSATTYFSINTSSVPVLVTCDDEQKYEFEDTTIINPHNINEFTTEYFHL